MLVIAEIIIVAILAGIVLAELAVIVYGVIHAAIIAIKGRP